MPKTCTSQKQETREIWISIFNFYSTCFCLFCNCLISAHAVGRWNWWQPFNTFSLQCPGQPLSYAGGHWRDNSPGSYEGDILNLIPSLHNFLLCEVILFVTDLLFWCFFCLFFFCAVVGLQWKVSSHVSTILLWQSRMFARRRGINRSFLPTSEILFVISIFKPSLVHVLEVWILLFSSLCWAFGACR